MADAQTRRQPSQARAERTQELVLDAAGAEFDAVGYQAASVRSIATAAQVSLGALYFHFPAKELLGAAVIQEQQKRQIRLISGIDADVEQPVIQRLMMISRALCDQLTSDPVIRSGIQLTFVENTFAHLARTSYQDWTRGTESLIAKAKQRGELQTTLNESQLATQLVSLFTGTQLVSQAVSGHRDLDAAMSSMWELVISGVVATDHREAARHLSEAIFPTS